MLTVDIFNYLQNVAQIARKVPTPVLRRAYVRAMQDWAAQSQWLRVSISGSTSADTPQYSLGSDTHLEVIGVYAMSLTETIGSRTQTIPLFAGDSGGWDANARTDRPRAYAYVPEGQIALYPTPNKAYSILTTAIVQPQGEATHIPEAPLRKYSTTFEAGALAYLLAMKDTPWYNPAEGDKFGREFGSGISNAKAEVQRNFNTGSQRVLPRPLFG